jgi:hypothetical protein
MLPEEYLPPTKGDTADAYGVPCHPSRGRRDCVRTAAYAHRHGADEPLAQPEEGLRFRLGVVGASYDDPDGASRQRVVEQCRVGECVRLIPEPDDSYDKFAVKVCLASGEQIGHLPRGHGLFRKVSDGRVSAVIGGIRGGTSGKCFLRVVVVITVRD